MKFDVQKYFESTTIHGLSYILTPKRFYYAERIFWVAAIISSAICTLILIAELIVKIQNFPIVSYLSDQSVPVSEINFPAVTVCPRFCKEIGRDYRKKVAFNQPFYFEKHTFQYIFYEMHEYLNMTKDEQKYGSNDYLKLLDDIDNRKIKPKELGIELLKRLQIVDFVTNRGVFSNFNISIPTDDFLDVINEFDKEFVPNIYRILFYWMNEKKAHKAEIITQWGLCYTFNIAFSHDLLNLYKTSNDFHYLYSTNEYYYRNRWSSMPPEIAPLKTSTSKAGLWVGFGFLNYDESDKIIQNDFEGFVVLLHNPYELPSRYSKLLKLNIKLQTQIFINAQLHSIDESLHDYQPSERNCYLENEKILQFFKIYTKNNCEQECLANYVLNRCNCVEFFMIRNSSTRICSASERSCYAKANEDFGKQSKLCDCYEPCEYVKYDFEVNEYGIANTNSRNPSLNIGFQMQYKSNVFNQLVRKKQFTTLDFLSFVGGFLGLFAGFSVLSLIELIYWFTIRVLLVNRRKLITNIHPLKEADNRTSMHVSVKNSVQSYFKESSIHGVNYIFGFSWISGFFWTLFIITSLTLCFHLILSTQESVPNSRVIAYDDSFKKVKNVPFPAITIVPQFSFSKQDSINIFWYAYGMPTLGKAKLKNETERETFIRDLARYNFCFETYNEYEDGFSLNFIPYITRILKENSQLDWFGEQSSIFNEKYQTEFAEIRTSRGMGFTFNMIDAEDLFNLDQVDQQFQYVKNVTTKSNVNLKKFSNHVKYPLTFNKIDQVKLTIQLTKPIGEFYDCVKQSFIVHHSDDLPTFTSRKSFVSFEFGTTVDVTVIPEITKTDKYLQKLKPTERECYFDGEKSLKIFKKYSQKNCEIECFANITMKICGCVDIEHPFNNEFEICLNFSRYRREDYCLNEIQAHLLTSENFSPETNCSCLPLCNSISYNIKYYTKNVKGGNETVINLRMDMDEIVLFRRYQQFTFSDVVSYVGGLLGLFAGISMLSIVEFIYFFTIRLGVNMWRIVKAK